MSDMTMAERQYILAGNHEMLDNYLATVRRDRLLAEKKYDDMIERKNATVADLKRDLAEARAEIARLKNKLAGDKYNYVRAYMAGEGENE